MVAPEPVQRPRPVLYAGGESEAAKTMIAARCDAYVMHGDPVEVVAEKIADMRARRREALELAPMTFGMAAYAIVRDSEAEARARWNGSPTWTSPAPASPISTSGSAARELERELQIQEYSVSNRGLRPSLIGTPEQIEEEIEAMRPWGSISSAADEPAARRDGAVRGRR